MSVEASSSTTPWQRIWNDARPTLEEIRYSAAHGEPPAPRIMRVGKLDAELLDLELVQVLQEPLTKALHLISSALKARFEPELALFIQLTLYKFSVWDSGASYGARLQGLKYAVPSWWRNRSSASSLPRRLLLIHGTLTLLVPYLHNKLRAHALSKAWPDAPSSDRRRKAWELLTRLESTHGLLSLMNFVGFLWNGRYRTIIDRLLDLRLVPAQRLTQREVSYEFMNRQMVWHAFTEFLLFLLPLINTRALSKRVSRIWSHLSFASLLPTPVRSLVGLETSATSGASSKLRRGKYWALSLDQCAICYEDASTSLNLNDPHNALTSIQAYPTSSPSTLEPPATENTEDEPPTHPIHSPYITDCGHTYCYVCITGRMMRTSDDASGIGPGGTRWECLRCGEPVSSADRVDADSDAAQSEFGYTSGDDMTFGSEDADFTDMNESAMGDEEDSEAAYQSD